MRILVYTDGGSRGNPGPSGFGVVIYDETKHILAKLSKFLGTKTNNEAEYLALLEALSWLQANASKLAVDSVIFYSDSQLLVRQMQGHYKVKAANIKPLVTQARDILSSLSISYQFTDIPREKNALADELANQAMDRR